MTDEELLLHQLKNPPVMSMALNKDHLYRMMADHMKGAADRIEQLVATNEALTAKLTNLVEKSNAMLDAFCVLETQRQVEAYDSMCALLAEIESSTPYGLEGEKT